MGGGGGAGRFSDSRFDTLPLPTCCCCCLDGESNEFRSSIQSRGGGFGPGRPEPGCCLGGSLQGSGAGCCGTNGATGRYDPVGGRSTG